MRVMRVPVFLLVALLALPCGAEPAPPLKAEGTLQAAFSPQDDIESLIVAAIDEARQQVLVQAYLLTSKKIAAALIRTQRRGIEVKVLVDARQLEKTTDGRISEMAAAGISVWLETAYQNAHNKLIVIDAKSAHATVITGSYNFTWTAQHKNAENVLIARDNPALAARYAANWERHRQDASPYRK
ncbi:MAG: phospholipase D family protein [Proteobacteria bacterium]|nr:phospholipase D family protein [Pseudomonadota bacterium]